LALKPLIQFIQAECQRQSVTYITVANLSGVKLSSLRRVMSKKARQPLLLREVSALYRALGYVFVPLAIKQLAGLKSTVSRVSIDYDCHKP